MIRSRQVFAPKAKTRARKAQLARCWLVGGAMFVLQTIGFDTAKSQEIKVNTLKQINCRIIARPCRVYSRAGIFRC